jgi:hypothetical protein
MKILESVSVCVLGVLVCVGGRERERREESERDVRVVGDIGRD